MRAYVVGILVGLSACTNDVDDARRRARDLSATDPSPRWPSSARLLERDGGGVVAYLGLDIDPPAPRAGQTITLTHYLRVLAPPRQDAMVFVHGEAGGRRVLSGDHPPLYGRLPTSAWRPGDVWMDRHAMKIPAGTTGTLELLAGLYRGSMRWTVEAPPGRQDGEDRLRAARIPLGAPATPANDLPSVLIPRAKGPITPDGVIDEAAWADAPVLTFADSLGRATPIRYATRLRLLYDDEHLYVAFEADDADITERYAQRDDPIYEHETVELFIMPGVAAPRTGPYVELQASPGGVIFDASFDGPRQGMNKRYEAGQTVGTKVDGTLNDPSPDRGWVSEWVVPFSGIRGVHAAPKPGDEWRMNAFRIEKHRAGRQLRGEYSAWSPPRVGDFHHVPRFGRMRFGGPEAP